MAVLSVSLCFNGRDNRSFNYQAVSKRADPCLRTPWFTRWRSPKQRCASEEVRAIAGDYNILASLISRAAGIMWRKRGSVGEQGKHAATKPRRPLSSTCAPFCSKVLRASCTHQRHDRDQRDGFPEMLLITGETPLVARWTPKRPRRMRLDPDARGPKI